ncbi:hypothetical protein BDZ89DRAFT_1065324 [Hymenopellis radicata]|nr:hypothetical protein BDZ89DRAFT_1065324 [Hymenopellis radicata]
MGINLAEEIQQRVTDYQIDHEHDPSEENMEALLEDAVESITDSSDAITDMRNFDVYASVLKHAKDVPAPLITKLLDSLVSGFQAEFDATVKDIKDDEQHGGQKHKEPLEHYAFLFYWFVAAAEDVKADDVTPATPVKPRKGRGGKAAKGASRTASKKDGDKWSWADQIPQTLGLMCRILRQLKTERVWSISSEREAFLTCITNPVYDIAQKESHMKQADIKQNVLRVICLAVKYQGHGVVAQTKIFSNLQFQEHLADPMADCLSILEKEFDHPQLADNILLDLSRHTFSEKETKGPRIFSRFIIRFSETLPAHTLKQISLILEQLDSEAYPIRLAVVEIIHNLVVHLDALKRHQEIDENQATKQINGFFDLLLERALDVSTYVRAKVLNVLARLCTIRDNKYYKKRLKITAMAVASLEDKAAGVRKNAIALLIALLKTNPYNARDGLLEEEDWKDDLEKTRVKMENMGLGDAVGRRNNPLQEQQADEEARKERQKKRDDGAMDVDDATDVEDEETEKGAEEEEEEGEEEDKDEQTRDEEEAEPDDMAVDEDGAPQPKKPSKKTKKKKGKKRRNGLKPRQSILDIDQINRHIAETKLNELEVTKLVAEYRYRHEGLSFIEMLEGSSETMVKLLASVNKTEVLEAIEFYLIASNFKLKLAKVGIKQMLHLIWQKDSGTLTSEDGQEIKGIRSKLLECYHWLYFEGEDTEAPPKLIAKNLIELTFDADLAHLTSLEEMLRIMMAEKKVNYGVIETLWKIYSVSKLIPKVQRRGAIVVISMLALADHTILHDHVDELLKVGFGKLGKLDLTLARYTCVALQRLNGSVKKVKGSLEDKTLRFDMNHYVFKTLRKFILLPCKSKEWFGVAEQIINTVYALGEHPDVFCNAIIKELTRMAFTPREPAGNVDADTQMADPDATQDEEQKDVEDEPDPMDEDHPDKGKDLGDAFVLSQLLFVVGHVAIKQLVFLELAEREMKRQRDSDAAAQGGQASKEVEELDQVVGNAEDDVGDQMAHIREHELLYGDRSLLKLFGPMLIHICSRTKKYKNPTLKAAATLSLSKFLCVSSQFCGDHHLLLFKLLELSDSPSIRSNIAIALGDVAVSFSTIIDENSHELYRGLSDKDLVVKKNTLMVLTHLILNGMIKVKGQLGEMAKCLVDENERIKGLAELFFKELSTKENAIYNNLPDVISHLSTGDHSVEESHFHNIMTHIFRYIEKDKQTENIVDKLCQRFHLTQDPRQWRDIAFCLSLLPYKSERSVKKLIEGLPHYRDKLHEPDVYDKFNQILVKARQNKGAGKPDTELNEFAVILEQNKEQGEQDNALEQRVQGKKAAAKRRANKRNAAAASAGTTAPTRATTRSKRRQAETVEEEDDDGLS